MKGLYIIFFVLIVFDSWGQDSLLIGKKYSEDQLYVGVVYNLITNKPDPLQQKGVSVGYQLGFIKDISLNDRGSIALGIGVGYAYNKYIHNLKIQNQTPEFSIIESTYQINKLVTHSIEFPFEIRLRTSSPTVYKFWRLYIGAKAAYIFASKTVFKNDSENIKLKPASYIGKWVYGPQIALGYKAWNFYAFYNANTLFKDAPESEELNIRDVKTLRIGLQFYIF